MTMARIARILLPVLLLSLLAGCANFIQDRKARDRQAHIEQAMRDDQSCREEGHRYPSIGYTRCRQSLQDKREQRQLYALRTIERDEATGMREPHHRPTTARGDFRCEERVWGNTEWIDCRTHYEQ